jgi:AbiU2
MASDSREEAMRTVDAAVRSFRRELEIFRTESFQATQYFYAFLTIHSVAGDDKDIHRHLNTAALFWKTNLGALQISTFIVLGRLFDPDRKSRCTMSFVRHRCAGALATFFSPLILFKTEWAMQSSIAASRAWRGYPVVVFALVAALCANRHTRALA